MCSEFYFAYGSNLNQEDLNRWCEEHNQPNIRLEVVGSAELPDYKLAFSTFSSSRNGGVLDVRESVGHCVEGVLFRVDPTALSILDRKEGAPSFYQRIYATVILPDGSQVKAITYQVHPEKAFRYVPPSNEYLEIVKTGYRDHGISDTDLAKAAKNIPCSMEDGFFFYGTLMREECRFSAVRRFGVTCAILAQTPGRLIDLGSYPAMLPIAQSDEMNEQLNYIQGDFIRLKNVSSALQTFDAIEGFRGYESQRSSELQSFYERTRVFVDVGEGRLRRAWTYCLSTIPEDYSEISSGDWRAHCGGKESFMDKLIREHTNENDQDTAEQLMRFLPFSMASYRTQAIQNILPLRHSLTQGIISERRLAQVSGKWTAAVE